MSITAMRQAIATGLGTLDSVEYAPTTVRAVVLTDQLPAAIVRYVGATQEVIETGGGTDNTWSFAVELVVGAVDEDAATEALEELVEDVLGYQRDNFTFGVFFDSSIATDGEPTVRPADESQSIPLLIQRLVVTGTTEED